VTALLEVIPTCLRARNFRGNWSETRDDPFLAQSSRMERRPAQADSRSAAVFVNGNFYFGADGLAGELGHTTIDERGEMCSCGNRGCLEVYASGWAIITSVRRALLQGVTSSLLETRTEHLSVEAIVDAARKGDRLSQTVLSEAGTHLATALANFVNLFNPQSIILGGAVPQVTKTFFLKSLSQALRYRAFHRSVSNLKLLVSHRVGQPGAVGVALVVAEQLSRQFCTSNYSD